MKHSKVRSQLLHVVRSWLDRNVSFKISSMVQWSSVVWTGSCGLVSGRPSRCRCVVELPKLNSVLCTAVLSACSQMPNLI